MKTNKINTIFTLIGVGMSHVQMYTPSFVAIVFLLYFLIPSKLFFRFLKWYIYMYMCILPAFLLAMCRAFVASENTLKTFTYDNWETRNGEVSHTVTMLVTPRITVNTAQVHWYPILYTLHTLRSRYTMSTFTWGLLTYSSNVIQQVIPLIGKFSSWKNFCWSPSVT